MLVQPLQGDFEHLPQELTHQIYPSPDVHMDRFCVMCVHGPAQFWFFSLHTLLIANLFVTSVA